MITIFCDDELIKAADKKIWIPWAEDINAKVENIQERVKDILKMYPADLYFCIMFLENSREVSEKFLELYGVKKKYSAFYSPSAKMIYCSVKHLNIKLLAHEICHVILTKNFKIRMPGHVQEVLCRWVESKI